MTSREGFADLSALMNEIKEARAAIGTADDARNKVVTELRDIIRKQQKAIDALSLKIGRPSPGLDTDASGDHVQALGLLETKALLKSPKREVADNFEPR
jgi:hypothetical protein